MELVAIPGVDDDNVDQTLRKTNQDEKLDPDEVHEQWDHRHQLQKEETSCNYHDRVEKGEVVVDVLKQKTPSNYDYAERLNICYVCLHLQCTTLEVER